jgi:P27 family predicted phage terminase small subunit
MVRQCSEILSAEGLLIETDRGSLEHPASRAMARFSAVMLKAASDCGFSPASRPRIQADPAQADRNPFSAFAGSGPARMAH